jgi:AcrR family transcriptional regulator
VGIDRIIAEAGVAKMSLHKHFPSKDDLILAVLQYREEGVLEFFRSAMERHGKKTKNPLQAFFAPLKEWFETPGFRGSAFQNAAVELADPAHPGTEFVRGHNHASASSCEGCPRDSRQSGGEGCPGRDFARRRGHRDCLDPGQTGHRRRGP